MQFRSWPLVDSEIKLKSQRKASTSPTKQHRRFESEEEFPVKVPECFTSWYKRTPEAHVYCNEPEIWSSSYFKVSSLTESYCIQYVLHWITTLLPVTMGKNNIISVLFWGNTHEDWCSSKLSGQWMQLKFKKNVKSFLKHFLCTTPHCHLFILQPGAFSF